VIHLGELRRCAKKTADIAGRLHHVFGTVRMADRFDFAVNGNRWLGIIRSSRAPRGGLGARISG